MKCFIWTDEASYTAFAHCENVTEARRLLRDEIGGYDGSCPEREKARKTMEEFTPSVYLGRIAGFRLSDSAEVRELEKYQEKLTAERDHLRAEVDRLRGERDNAERNWKLTQKRATKWALEIDAATARAEAAERERDEWVGAYLAEIEGKPHDDWASLLAARDARMKREAAAEIHKTICQAAVHSEEAMGSSYAWSDAAEAASDYEDHHRTLLAAAEAREAGEQCPHCDNTGTAISSNQAGDEYTMRCCCEHGKNRDKQPTAAEVKP